MNTWYPEYWRRVVTRTHTVDEAGNAKDVTTIELVPVEAPSPAAAATEVAKAAARWMPERVTLKNAHRVLGRRSQV